MKHSDSVSSGKVAAKGFGFAFSVTNSACFCCAPATRLSAQRPLAVGAGAGKEEIIVRGFQR